MATIYDAQTKSFPKKVPHKLLSTIESDAGFSGLIELSDITISNWTLQDQCGFHNSILSTNPSASDATPTHHLKKFNYNKNDANVDTRALIYMDSPNDAWINPDDCVDMSCTGLYNVIFKLDDETILPDDGLIGQIVPNYPLAFSDDLRCRFEPDWNAFKCGNSDYEILTFESLDEDRYSRRLHPVNVSNVGDVYSYQSYLNSYMDRRWDDSYTSLLRLSRFPVVVELGKQFNIEFQGSNPRKLRY